MRLLDRILDIKAPRWLARACGGRSLKCQRGFWNLVAGAGLGALGGAMQKKPMQYQPFDQMTDASQRQQFSGDTMDYLNAMRNGQPLMSQGEINRQLSGSYGRLDADAAASRQRIGERALGRQGHMGGMAEASFAELERANLGQKRQLEAGIQNSLASQAPQMRMNAASMGLNFLGNQEQMAAQQHAMQQASAAQRAGFSKWGNIIGGAIGGAGAMSGMGGMFGGGGGQQGGGGGTAQGGMGGVPMTGGPMQGIGYGDVPPWMR